MSINLSGKTALITGASRGIGEAAARIMAGYGANVVLAARSTRDTARIAADIGDRALAVTCDVAQYVDVENAVAEAIRSFGSLDILVNNAGVIDPIARIEDSDAEAWDQVVDINFKGVYHGLRSAIPVMKRQGGGVIINISSGRRLLRAGRLEPLLRHQGRRAVAHPLRPRRMRRRQYPRRRPVAGHGGHRHAARDQGLRRQSGKPA